MKLKVLPSERIISEYELKYIAPPVNPSTMFPINVIFAPFTWTTDATTFMDDIVKHLYM